MNTYKIYVSNNQMAEEVNCYKIESNEDMKTVVKAAALKALYEEIDDPEEVESINFDADTFGDRYVVCIQCAEYHISVWCDNSEPHSIISMKDELIALAKNIEDDTYYSVTDENVPYNGEITSLYDNVINILD